MEDPSHHAVLALGHLQPHKAGDRIGRLGRISRENEMEGEHAFAMTRDSLRSAGKVPSVVGTPFLSLVNS